MTESRTAGLESVTSPDSYRYFLAVAIYLLVSLDFLLGIGLDSVGTVAQSVAIIALYRVPTRHA